MRDIYTLIDAILTLIPDDQTDFINGLRRVKRDAPYKAPEIAHHSFRELGLEFEQAIGVYPREDWQFSIIAIFMGINVAEVRKQFTP